MNKINTLNTDASQSLIELTKVMKALQFVRNNTIHAIVMGAIIRLNFGGIDAPYLNTRYSAQRSLPITPVG